MRKYFLAWLTALLMVLPAAAQFTPPSGTGLSGALPAPSTSGNVMTSNGTSWTSAAPSGGGGSPFAPAGFTNISTFDVWRDLAVAPAGDYVYVAGELTASGNGAIAKVSVEDGSIAATVDLGAGKQPQSLAVSPDGAAVYAIDKATGTTWWKIATAGMTVTQASTLAVAAAVAGTQQFDLSPDGTKYVYVTGADAKLYIINTSSYAVSDQTMNNTAGNLTAVCFYNGSNTNVYVAHAAQADVDLYAIGGAYASSVSTGTSGTESFIAMRSGINDTFWISDSGTNDALICVGFGSPTIVLTEGYPATIATNALTPVAIDSGTDMCFFRTSGGKFFWTDGGDFLSFIPWPVGLFEVGSTGLAVMPDNSGRIMSLGGVNYPEVFSLETPYIVVNAGTAGNIQKSDGLGNWTSSGTISVSGSVTAGTSVTATSGDITATNGDVVLSTAAKSLKLTEAGGAQTVSVNALAQTGNGVAQFPDLGGATKVITCLQDGLYEVRGTLSAANIIAMKATPIELIPAPGAGKFIGIVQAGLYFTYGGTQFTGGGNVFVGYNSAVGNTATLMSSGVMTGTADGISTSATASALASQATTNFINTNYAISNATADFATGNGTLKYRILYRIVDFN